MRSRHSHRGRPLLHVGERKGEHLDAAVRARRPARALELGSYLGYSAVGSPGQPRPASQKSGVLPPMRFALRAAYPMPGRRLEVTPCAAKRDISGWGAPVLSGGELPECHVCRSIS